MKSLRGFKGLKNRSNSGPVGAIFHPAAEGKRSTVFQRCGGGDWGWGWARAGRRDRVVGGGRAHDGRRRQRRRFRILAALEDGAGGFVAHRAGRAPAAKAARVDMEAQEGVEAKARLGGRPVGGVDPAEAVNSSRRRHRLKRNQIEGEIIEMGAARRAARAGVERRVAIARHRLDRAQRRANPVADEAQGADHVGPEMWGGTSKGLPPHSRHMLAVRSICQVGSTPQTPAACCQASNERTWPRTPGLEASQA